MSNNQINHQSPSPLGEELIKAKLELEKQEFSRQKQEMFTKAKRTIVRDLNRYTYSTSILSTFTIKQVSTFMQNPIQYEKQLRQLSNYLYSISGNYKSMVQFFALLPKYSYIIEPYVVPVKLNKEKYKEAYLKTLKDIEKMNLRHEMINAAKIAFREDVFYGYLLESKDTFFIMHLDADNCKISSKEDGVFNYAFDFSYFDRHPDELDRFPEEFRQKYLLYQANTADKFIELSSDKTICLKVNEDLDFPLIPLGNVFEALFNLDDYEKIKKQRTKMDNFLLLTQKIPQNDKNDASRFTIDLGIAGEFHEMLSQAVEDAGVAVALSPMEIEPVRMERSKNDADTTAQAQRDVYSAAGLPQQLFNSEQNSAAGINKAIMVAEQISFAMLRQIERWVNRRLERVKGQYKFHIKFLDITEFNKSEVQDSLHKATTSALPLVIEYAASLGMSPLDLHNKAILENEVLGLHDMLRPLATSHTQSKSDEAGRGKKDDANVSESTESWRETDAAQGET